MSDDAKKAWSADEEIRAALDYFAPHIRDLHERENALLIYEYVRRAEPGDIDRATATRLCHDILELPDRAETLERWQRVFDPLQAIENPAEREVAIHLRELRGTAPRDFEEQSASILNMAAEQRQEALKNEKETKKSATFADFSDGDERLSAQLLLIQVTRGAPPNAGHVRMVRQTPHETRIEMLNRAYGHNHQDDPLYSIRDESERAEAIRLRDAMGTDWRTFRANSQTILAMAPEQRQTLLANMSFTAHVDSALALGQSGRDGNGMPAQVGPHAARIAQEQRGGAGRQPPP